MTDHAEQNERFLLRWTIARKVAGLVAVLLLLPLLIAGFTYRSLERIGREMTEVVDGDLAVTKAVSTLHVRQLEQHVVLERLLRSTGAAEDRAARDQGVAEFERLSRDIDADLVTLDQTVDRAIRGGSDEYQRFTSEVQALQRERDDFATAAGRAIADTSAGTRSGLTGQFEKEAGDVDRQVARMLAEVEGFTAESTQAALADERAVQRLSLIVAALGIVAAFVLSVLFIGGLRRALGGVTRVAVDIAGGNLHTEPVAIRSTDELGQLGSIFNGMLAGLRTNVTQTRSAAESLNAAVAEIVASVQEQAATAHEQAAAVQETTATMEEINQSGNQIADRARQVASSAEATSTATHQGMDAVRNGTTIMEAIQAQTETVAENIIALSEKTQAVGEIIASVSDIAERSNLLALNAAIEAAVAGEQGRRFTVVATEIKNLADQAKDATGKVRNILGDIQKGINTSVMLTEEVVKRVDSGKTQAEVVERTIQHATDSLNASIQAFQQITAATGQQQIGVDQVTQALKNIRHASSQTAVSTNQLEQAATNLSALGQQLSKSVERYRT